MDNVTHTLAGMLLAEMGCAVAREQRPRVRRGAVWVSALANNLPDSDALYTWLIGPKPLGSLLHHRGHTHTLVVALPAAWLLGALSWRLLSRGPGGASLGPKRLIYGLSLLGVLVHLLLDFGNNYGVHPFWPVSSRWFYGDRIFIVEPFWWAVAVPVLVRGLQSRALSWLLGVLLTALLLVCWFVPFVLPETRFALLAVTAVSIVVARHGAPSLRLGFAAAAWLLVAITFGLAGAKAELALGRATVAAFPALDVEDIALSPLPGNPLCWEALVIGRQGDSYRVLRASVAVPPLATQRCPAGDNVVPTAPVVPIDRGAREGVRFRSEYAAPVSQLRDTARRDCRFRALLRFARAPYVSEAGTGAQYAGDLRYDRSPEPDFSDVRLPSPASTAPCPRWVPNWTMPRAELFSR